MGMEDQAQDLESLVAGSQTKEDALRNTIRAAELYLGAAKLANHDTQKVRLRAKCNLLLSKAEEIKNSVNWSPTIQGLHWVCLEAPICKRKITTKEELILLEGSKLNDFLFPRWTSDPSDADFDNEVRGEPLYTLSQIQRGIFDGWRRPDEQRGYNSETDQLPIISTLKEIDLVQDITTDCSVVASLCAIVSRASKGHGMLINSIIYPSNKEKNCPAISSNGKYICRFQFNGSFRKVIIDNRLPTSSTNRNLHVVDRNNPRLYWPALIEKAYLKVRGGYDFPGSNSGTDLWVITGWIPEQVFLQSDDVQLEQLWARVYKAFGYGDVMITLGTGKLTHNEVKELGLAAEHDYVILDMKECNSQQLLLIKNPWHNGMVFKKSCEIGQSAEEIRKSSPEPSKPPVGTFWMDLGSVVQHFESLYLNWNPGLFRHRQDHHFTWNIPEISNSGSLIHNPQYIMRSSYKETVWIILNRYFSTEEQDPTNYSNITQTKTSSAPGFISLYVFEKNGQRVYLGERALHRGVFVDSPHTLARFDVSPSKKYTIVIAQQDLPFPKYSFTLSCFSRFPLSVHEAIDQQNYWSSHIGVWNFRTAGGNASSSSFPMNPQYSIFVSSKADIELFLEADKQDLAVNVKMVWAGGERVTTATSRDIVGDSGDYRRGCALVSLKSVAAGKYTIICSTFESGQTGNFKLFVGSSVHCQVRQILSETAGRLCFKLEPLIFTEHVNRMLAPLTITRLTKLRLVANSTLVSPYSLPPRPRPLLKLSLERRQGLNRIVLGVSGNGGFNESPMGLRLGDVDLSPDMSQLGGLWIVVERLGERQCRDSIEVEILSDNSVTVGTWGIDID